MIVEETRVVPLDTKRPVTIPENMKAAAGWLLYKFATEAETGHFKQMALFIAEEIAKTLPHDEAEMDELINSYMEEIRGL